jgi:hypothetical protein
MGVSVGGCLNACDLRRARLPACIFDSYAFKILWESRGHELTHSIQT